MRDDLMWHGASRPTPTIKPQEPWHALDPLWEGGEDVVEQGLPHEELAPAWQVLILGDFSPTRHFRLLSGEKTRVEVIDMSPIGMTLSDAPPLIRDIPGPRLRRQIWLCTSSGQRLGYAVSWWEATKVNSYLRDKSLPVWENLAQLRTELYRDIFKVQYGNSAALEEAFGYHGPFWARYYFFIHKQKPLTLIYEVFSPYLEKYLGQCRSFSLPT